MTLLSAMLPAAGPLLLSAAMTLLCLRAAGPSQGVFFGGLAFAVLIASPFAAAERNFRGRAIVASSVIVGTSLAWLLAVHDPYVTWRHWFGGTAVLTSVVVAIAGIVAALRGARLPTPLAAALATLLFAAWLTWPIWLSPHAAGRPQLVGALATPHPLLALDGFLADLGPPWPERATMYNEWSVLNQDVAYESPPTILWAVVLHLFLGGAGAAYALRRRGQSAEGASDDARRDFSATRRPPLVRE